MFAAREPGEELQHLSGAGGATACATATPARCWTRRCGSSWTSECATGSSRRHAGIRWRCSSCRAGLTRHASWPAGSGCWGRTPLSGRIEESFVRRLEALPERRAAAACSIAAAEPVGDPLLLLRASERLGISGLRPSTRQPDGLLAIEERVTFRHPLVRSAVYRSADAHERRTAHLALAEATDRDVDPDRRAWHLAAAAAGPDEAVALELERSADRAQARGGLAAAAAFLQRAVALTGDPARRVDRALAAAQASLGAGAFDAALGLLATAEVGPLDELQRARLDLLRAEAAYSESRGSAAPALLLRAAKTLEPLDPQLARETYLDAWSSALFAGRLASSASLHEVSREAQAARRPADTLRVRPICCWTGFRWPFTDGRSAAAPVLEQAATGFAGSDVSVEEVLRWGWLATAAAVMVWDYETCVAVATRGVELAREAGALTVLAVSVNVMAQAVVLGGEFGRAALACRRGRQRDRGHGHPSRAVRCPRARRLSGPRGLGLRADRRHHRAIHGRGPGNRCPIRALGALGAPQRSRPLSKRRWPPRRTRATTRPSCSFPSGRRSRCSNPRPGATSRNSHAMLSSASLRPRPSRPPIGPSASRPVPVRC